MTKLAHPKNKIMDIESTIKSEKNTRKKSLGVEKIVEPKESIKKTTNDPVRKKAVSEKRGRNLSTRAIFSVKDLSLRRSSGPVIR